MPIPKTMKAAVLHGVHDLRIEERPVPVPGPGEALLRVRAVGVCGSEIHYYREGRIGDAVVDKPVIPGHEFAGEVVALGPGVEGVEVGQAVAVDPAIPCHKCELCIAGDNHVCLSLRFCGMPGQDGAYREYLAWPAENCHPLPPGADFVAGAMAEPAAVGFQALKVAPVRLGDSVLIIGCGPIGLVTLQAALLSGAAKVIVSDVLDYRLDVARQLGADVVLNPKRDDVLARVMEETGGMGVDVAYEAYGSAETFQQAIEAARPRGRVGLIGIPAEDELPLNLHKARRKESRIVYVRRCVNEYPRVLAMMEAGRLDLGYLVTHTFPLDRVEEALQRVEAYGDGVVKALVEM